MKSVKIFAITILFTCCGHLLFAGCNFHADFSFTPALSNNAFTYKFTDLTKIPAGAMVARLWNFGDGGTATTFDPVHQYTSPGVYKVCLVVCVAGTGTTTFCCDTICKEIRICADMKVDFTYTVTGNTVIYTAQANSPATPLTYSWSFQGGNPATSGTHVTTVQYANPGTYQVCLKVVDAHGCYGYSCKNITIGANTSPCDGVKANFKFDGKKDNTVTLVAVPQKPGTFYQWSMDGVMLTNPNPNTAFTVTNIPSGNHKFCLIVFSGTSLTGALTPCDDTCQTISFNNNNCSLNASWTWSYTNTGAIYFVSVPNPVGVIHKWSFGDGTYSELPNPAHSYVASGVYKVCHWVSIPGTVCKDSSCNEVKTVANTGCKSYFTWSPMIGNITAVAFTNQSHSAAGDEIISYKWYFGDSAISDDKNPVHTYNAAGQYKVCLAIKTKSGCVSYYCDSVNVAPINPPSCKSYYEWERISGTMSVNFIGHPQVAPDDSIITYKWRFGDGATDYSNKKNVEHIYLVPGNYQACLIIITKKGCISEYCDTVIIGSVNNICHSYFKWAVTTLNGAVSFYDASTVSPGDSITKYYWYFGDGSNGSDAKNPVHTYNAAGRYNVCHTITTKMGCTSTRCDSVWVGQNTSTCKAEYSFEIHGCDTVYFKNKSTGNYTNIEWKFGDGTGSKDGSPKHIFAPGTYTVVLTISNSATNCFSSVYHVITIQPCHSDTICGNVFNDNNGNGIFDAGDTPVAGMQINFSGVNNFNVKTDAQGHYIAVLPAGSHYVHIYPPSGCVLTVPSGMDSSGVTVGGYYIPAGKKKRDCIYNFGINCNLVRICGVVYYDTNGNGTRENNEKGIAHAAVLLMGATGKTYHAYTSLSGEYCIKVPTGVYVITVTVPLTAANCKIKPEHVTVTANTAGQSYLEKDFGVNCPSHCDLKVTLTPNVSITPGFPTWFTIFVCNTGSMSNGGVVNFQYDEALEYVYSNPPHSAANMQDRVVSWNLSPIPPGDCRYMVVHLNTKKNAVIGKSTKSFAEVIPGSGCTDANMGNNADTTYKEITGSWDPNNKMAYLTNYITNSKYQMVSSVNSNQRIEYVINFQNKGNAPAYNIVVQDTFSTDLDMESYEFMGASHPVTVNRNNNAVSYSFENINLPAEMDDEPNSHGFVIFSINSKAGLPAGHIISDAAAIYFDFNQPVITDDATVVMIDLTGIKNEPATAATVTLSPNPMNDHVRITLSGTDTEGFTLQVISIDGRLVMQENSLSNTLNLSRNQLSAGMYIYEILQHNQPVARGKMIVQ